MKKLNPYSGLLAALLLIIIGGCREDPIEIGVFGNLQGWAINEAFDTLDQVIVTTNPSTDIVTTDPAGFFLIESIPVGEYAVRANRAGYREESVSISILEDQTTEVTLILTPASDNNTPPSPPSNPNPPNGAVDQPLDVLLSWDATDEDPQDTLRYDLFLFSEDFPDGMQVLIEGLDTFFQLNDLKYATDYYWQVVVADGNHSPVYGESWHFRTEPFPDLPIHYVRKENGKYDIYGADLEGRRVRLTNRVESSWRPRMSPLRDKIAFLSFEDFEVHLYTMDVDGENVRKVTSSIPVGGYNNFELDFCWTDNGAQLLYMYFDKLYRINRDGTGLTLIGQAPQGMVWAEVDWNEAGNFIAARARSVQPYTSKVYLLRPGQGYVPELLVDDLPGATGGPAIYIDGSRLLITRDLAGFEQPSGRQLNARIFSVDVSTGDLMDVSGEKEDGTNDLDPRYSPTGAKIIFVNTPNDGASRRDLWMMQADGENRELLIENAEMPDWN